MSNLFRLYLYHVSKVLCMFRFMHGNKIFTTLAQIHLREPEREKKKYKKLQSNFIFTVNFVEANMCMAPSFLSKHTYIYLSVNIGKNLCRNSNFNMTKFKTLISQRREIILYCRCTCLILWRKVRTAVYQRCTWKMKGTDYNPLCKELLILTVVSASYVFLLRFPAMLPLILGLIFIEKAMLIKSGLFAEFRSCKGTCFCM